MPEEQEDGQQEDFVPDESDTQEIVDEETSISAEELTTLRERAAKAEEWKGFADRTAAENKRLKKQLAPQAPKAEAKSSIPETGSQDTDERFERLELKTEGYSEEEISQIMELGGKAALGNPIVKKAIDIGRKERRSKEATPGGTAKSPTYRGVSENDAKTMPFEDLEKLVSQQ